MTWVKLVFLVLIMILPSSSRKTCPNCGDMQVPYPLSTNPSCGDPDYSLRCDFETQKLYFDALNGSSYLVLQILRLYSRMIIQPSPWLPGKCITRDMQTSEGFWLNHSRPFSVTSSNTIFLFNCSPRLLLSPLNCTPSSLCHDYLQNSGRVDPEKSQQCASGLSPCCTFVAGGIPSAYKIRLHSSGCRAFRSVFHLNPLKPAKEWTEGLEIQWASPPEPICKIQLDCSENSKCSVSGTKGLFRCFCNEGYYWDPLQGTCLGNKKRSSRRDLELKISVGVIFLFILLATIAVIIVKRSSQRAHQLKLAKAREDMLSRSNGGKPARIFRLKEVKRATNGFSRDRVLGSGAFGEVYKGELQDGTTVAIKLAKLGSLKSTQQVLNEVGILSQVNHKNLVRLMGCCIESEQPLMINEYIPNGNLYEHLHRSQKSNFLDWKMRLKIAMQTAEALTYLHSAAYTPIYHRDVKSNNILLDSEFNAKVADFGLSRLAHPGLSHVSTCAQGTLGYLDPEYHRNYQLTDKSDVYSYGVVMLELITSQKAIDFSREEDEVNLAIYVDKHVKKGDIMEVVDGRLIGERPQENGMVRSMRGFAEIALECVREKKGERPSMKDVLEGLQRVSRDLNLDLDLAGDGGEGETIVECC